MVNTNYTSHKSSAFTEKKQYIEQEIVHLFVTYYEGILLYNMAEVL
jgi:hypothetical protein